MKKILLNKGSRKEWDRFALDSDDAWFWHTIDYIDYIVEYSANRFIDDQSFFIEDAGKIQAICPAIIENMGHEGKDDKQLCYAYDPMPAIAMKNGLSQTARGKVMEFYISELNNIASEKGADSVALRIPSLARSHLFTKLPPANPFIKYGYLDLPYQTQIIDLRKDLKELWGDVSKGHKADVKKGQKILKVNIWDSSNISADKFEQYRDLHRKDAGKVTRSKKTFDMMYEWVKNGNAMLVEAEIGNSPAAFTLIITYKDGAYYGSSCKDPERCKLPSSHLIQWEAIKRLKDKKFLFYDIGLQHYGSEWFYSPSAKEVNISKFKRGFGGVSIPVIVAERCLSKELTKERFLERMNKNFNLHR